jgi:chromosome segregation ATPase
MSLTFSRISLERNQITDDYMLLQKAYTSLQELKERLENKESEIQHNLTDAHKETDQNKTKLKQAQKHIDDLEKKCDKYELSISELNNNLNSLHSEYDFLSLRTKVVSIELSIQSDFYPKFQKSKTYI